MATSRIYLLEEEIEQNLLEKLSSDQNSFSDESDNSGTDDITVDEVINAEYNDEGSDVHFSAPCGAPSASNAIFTWEDMTNYVGQREQFVDNSGPQNEAQNETHYTKVVKMFFDDELVELIVRETNTYAAQKIQPEVSFHCVPECGTGNRSLQTK
jgi:hypothetical protein